MTAPDVTRILTDHAPELTALEDRLWHERGIHRFGVSYKTGVRDATRAVLEWVLTKQHTGFDELTVGELIEELRKTNGSIYWPIKAEDPTFSHRCERCGQHVLVTAEGYCVECAHEFI
jgi:hypothetical protein